MLLCPQRPLVLGPQRSTSALRYLVARFRRSNLPPIGSLPHALVTTSLRRSLGRAGHLINVRTYRSGSPRDRCVPWSLPPQPYELRNKNTRYSSQSLEFATAHAPVPRVMFYRRRPTPRSATGFIICRRLVAREWDGRRSHRARMQVQYHRTSSHGLIRSEMERAAYLCDASAPEPAALRALLSFGGGLSNLGRREHGPSLEEVTWRAKDPEVATRSGPLFETQLRGPRGVDLRGGPGGVSHPSPATTGAGSCKSCGGGWVSP